MKNVVFLLSALLGLAARPAAGQVQYQLTGRMLSISDIHFAIPDSVPLRTQLQQADTAAWAGILAQDPVFYQYGWGNDTHYDTHYQLLASSLQAMQAACPKPDFIVITGDFLGHDFPFTDLPFLTKTYQFLAGQLKRRFPDTPVLTGLGNNDTDTGDYNQPTRLFRAMFASTWAGLMHFTTPAERVQFDSTFSRGGYYAYTLPGAAGGQLFMLNSVSFYADPANNPGRLQQNRRATRQQLHWLTARLHDTTPASKLWFAMHIPFGIDVYKSMKKIKSLAASPGGACAVSASDVQPMWRDSVTTVYLKLMAAYQDRVRVGLAGHTHMDEFRLNYDAGSAGGAATYLHITPAITPVFYNNPGFQVLTYDPKQLGLLDSRTTYLPLQTAPAPGTPWQPEYDFGNLYGLAKIDSVTLGDLSAQLAARPTFAESYRSLFSVSGPNPVVPADWRYYWCATKSATAQNYRDCLCTYQPPATTPPVAVRRPPSGKAKARLARPGR